MKAEVDKKKRAIDAEAESRHIIEVILVNNYGIYIIILIGSCIFRKANLQRLKLRGHLPEALWRIRDSEKRTQN